MFSLYKSKNLDIFVNNTKNPNLREYRKEFHSNPFKHIFKSVINNLKIKFLSLICQKDFKKSYKRRNVLDRKWIIEELNQFRLARKMAEHSVKVVPLLIGNQLVCVDEKIALTVFSLNKMGIKTSFCCEGHKYEQMECSAYIALDKGLKFPQELIQALKESGVGYEIVNKKDNFSLGDTLYSRNSDQDNKSFFKILNAWALNQNNLGLFELKRAWRS